MLFVIAVVSVIAIASLFVVEDALTWLGGLVQQLLTALISLGKSIAGVAGGGGTAALAIFVVGNFVLICVILLSARLHFFTKGKSRPIHLAIASATLFARVIPDDHSDWFLSGVSTEGDRRMVNGHCQGAHGPGRPDYFLCALLLCHQVKAEVAQGEGRRCRLMRIRPCCYALRSSRRPSSKRLPLCGTSSGCSSSCHCQRLAANSPRIFNRSQWYGGSPALPVCMKWANK